MAWAHAGVRLFSGPSARVCVCVRGHGARSLSALPCPHGALQCLLAVQGRRWQDFLGMPSAQQIGDLYLLTITGEACRCSKCMRACIFGIED